MSLSERVAIFVKPEVTHTFWQLLDRGFAWPDRPSGPAYGAIKELARAAVQCFADLGARDMGSMAVVYAG